VDGRRARVFGWFYRTLEGHFEEGQMNYELWKWMDSGEVFFRLHAVSRPARSGPLLTEAQLATEATTVFHEPRGGRDARTGTPG
jgi:uncharacterized protein (UPF0548 family)